jgi:hypothetical protein
MPLMRSSARNDGGELAEEIAVGHGIHDLVA